MLEFSDRFSIGGKKVDRMQIRRRCEDCRCHLLLSASALATTSTRTSHSATSVWTARIATNARSAASASALAATSALPAKNARAAKSAHCCANVAVALTARARYCIGSQHP